MAVPSVEDWMHASDEERETMQQAWDVEKGQGEEIIQAVANLFQDECVYNVGDVGIVRRDKRWLIEAYVEDDDYENLKDRTNIEFLGFGITFSKLK